MGTDLNTQRYLKLQLLEGLIQSEIAKTEQYYDARFVQVKEGIHETDWGGDYYLGYIAAMKTIQDKLRE